MRRLFVSLAALTALSLPASAQLDLSFSPSASSLNFGDTLIFTATLTNTSPVDTISLVGFGGNLFGPDPVGTLTWITDPFESGLPLELAPGETYSAAMSIEAILGGTPGAYTATYSVDGEDPSFNPISASADLTLDVGNLGSAAPEPGTLAFVALAGIAAPLLRRRR